MIGIGVPVGNLGMLCEEDAVGCEFQRGAGLLGKAALQVDPLGRGSMARIASQASVAEAIISCALPQTRVAGSPSA